MLLLPPRSFALAVNRFNEHWLLERHGFLSPRQARRELMLKHAAWCGTGAGVLERGFSRPQTSGGLKCEARPHGDAVTVGGVVLVKKSGKLAV